MYDLDGDDKISRDEMLAVLHMMVGANISEDQVKLFIQCVKMRLSVYIVHVIMKILWSIPFLARLHFSAEELLLYCVHFRMQNVRANVKIMEF